MPKRPGFVFYPDDWMNDIGLRQCSRSTRGIWIDLLCLMHQGDPYGHLCSRSGSLPLAFISQTCGVTLTELADAILELDKFGVLSRDESGVIFSRKMVRGNGIRPPVELWAVLRLEIFRRDKWTCQYCGSIGGHLECDHIQPVSRGGSNQKTNLATACYACNRSKNAKTLKEWAGGKPRESCLVKSGEAE